jgi:peptidoglycan L-alanyl-D-glutamate endopeptidase CwlK
MPKFSKLSLSRLSTCHPDLQVLANEVIKHIDIVILAGYRNQKDQDSAYNHGNSKLKFPASKHNKSPSLAFDFAPWPINWHDTDRFYYFAGFILSTAVMLKAQGKITHSVRSGMDWDRDTQVLDEKFKDLGHVELIT